jgi:hypothetical protein
VTLVDDSVLGTAAFWLKIRYDQPMNLNSTPAIALTPDSADTLRHGGFSTAPPKAPQEAARATKSSPRLR